VKDARPACQICCAESLTAPGKGSGVVVDAVTGLACTFLTMVKIPIELIESINLIVKHQSL
jgi:hypothetical protein